MVREKRRQPALRAAPHPGDTLGPDGAPGTSGRRRAAPARRHPEAVLAAAPVCAGPGRRPGNGIRPPTAASRTHGPALAGAHVFPHGPPCALVRLGLERLRPQPLCPGSEVSRELLASRGG